MSKSFRTSGPDVLNLEKGSILDLGQRKDSFKYQYLNSKKIQEVKVDKF